MLEKWTKPRTSVAEGNDVIKKVKRSELNFVSTVLEITRGILELSINSTLGSTGWLLNYDNDIESFKNKHSTGFINWKDLPFLVWVTSAINPDSNTDVQIKVEVDSVEVFIIDSSLIFSTNGKGNKQKTNKLIATISGSS